MVLKGLPLSYNKDLQEDKEAVFNAPTPSPPPPRVHGDGEHPRGRPRPRGSSTEGSWRRSALADYLTRRGVPFREAHRIAGSAVRRAEERGVRLGELALEDYRALHPVFAADLYDSISIEGALDDKDVVGGTAPSRVRAELERVVRLVASGGRREASG